LLLEISQVAEVFGELDTTVSPPQRTQAKLANVMSTNEVLTGPLLWLAARLAKNRERAGVHYSSDSAASRFLAGAIWALLMTPAVSASTATPPGAAPVTADKLIDCPTLKRVLAMARAEWVR
jgi:hypothetical protein